MSNQYLAAHLVGGIPFVVYLIVATFLPNLKGRRLLFFSALVLVSVAVSTLFNMFVASGSAGNEPDNATSGLTTALWHTALLVVIAGGATYYFFARANAANMQPVRQSWWVNAAYMLMVLWLVLPKFWPAIAVFRIPKGYLLLLGFVPLLFAICYLFYFWRREGSLCPVPSNSASAFFRKAALVLMALVGIVLLAAIAAIGLAFVQPKAALGSIVGLIGGSVVVSLLCWGALVCFELARWFSFSRGESESARATAEAGSS